MDTYIVGSLAFDRILDFPGYFRDWILPDKIHMLNVAFATEKMTVRHGGTGGNIAYSLSLFGQRSALIASAGNDFAAYREKLEHLGVDLSRTRVHGDVPCAQAHIITDRSNNQITAFYSGAMQYAIGWNFDGFNPKTALVIVSPTNTEDMLTSAHACKKLGIRCIIDPGQQITSFSPDDLQGLLNGQFLCIVNDYELALLLEKTGYSHEQLLRKVESVLVTKGEQGSILATREGETAIKPCFSTNLADPTGAGDAYRAGIIAALAVGIDLPIAAQIGSVAATYALESVGTQEHVFTKRGFEERYQQTYQCPCPAVFNRSIME